MAGKIPFVNLDRQYDSLRSEIEIAIGQVFDAKAFILGPYVEKFEREFAAFQGTKHAIGCSSGTSAISLALEAAGVGRGDEVVTVGHTFAASAGAIRHARAEPIFVDIEPAAYLMDVGALEAAITVQTKAIMPVHIYGTPCDMPAIGKIAERRGLAVIEDAAQAHGATVGGHKVGGLGTAATFSFYPGKNLGAYGDAGAIATNDDALADRIRKLRDHGRVSKYVHDTVGYNHRMDGIQGAVLSVKLKYLAAWNERRRTVAARYDAVFRPRGFKTIEPPPGVGAVYHLYVVEVSNRDVVLRALADRGIATGVHYPVPLNRQPAFEPWAGGISLPVTERIVPRIMSLPICAEITDAEQDQVIAAFLDVAAA
ncbi:MAG: DegT/DnrJ/EryC1/StrS family aminotransferase [Planctomycetota bacterium]